MELRNRATGAVITDSQFRSENPNTSFPPQLTAEIIDSFGYDPVLEGPQATVVPPYQYSQRDGVVEINGQWFTHYIAGPVFTDNDDATAAEQEAAYRQRLDDEQAKRVREERNKRLADSDWRVTYEVEKASIDGLGIFVPTVWTTYRQALRDITSQAGFPWEVVWPVEP